MQELFHLEEQKLHFFCFHNLFFLFFNIFKIATLKILYTIKEMVPENLRSLAQKIKEKIYFFEKF